MFDEACLSDFRNLVRKYRLQLVRLLTRGCRKNEVASEMNFSSRRAAPAVLVPLTVAIPN